MSIDYTSNTPYNTIEEDEHEFGAGCAGNLRSDIRYRRGEGAIADPTEILATRKDQGTDPGNEKRPGILATRKYQGATVHNRDQ